jgi:two-component system response regulator
MRRPVVLIVEDSVDDQDLMRLAMDQAQRPFETEFVADGQEALEWVFRRGAHAERDPWSFPALILLDLKLPLVGGLEVLRALRQDPEGRRIPVVVLTTSAMPSDILQAYELGANAFVQKPAKFQELVALVQAIQAFWLSFNVLHPELR